MAKTLAAGLLALTAITCSLVEGLIELSPHLMQLTGLLSTLCAVALVGWSATIKTQDSRRD
jgi:hypothetical protein